MKWQTIIENALKKAGFKDDEIKSGIENLEGDIEDDIANSRLTSIFTADEAKGNDAIFKEVTSKAKAEALNAIDAEFKTVEGSLSVDQKKAYTALGANTYEKNKYLMKVLDEKLKEKTGDANYETLKSSYEELKSSLESNYVKKEDHDALASKYGNATKENVHSKIMLHATTVVKDPSKQGRHFERNFLQDFEDYLGRGVGKEKTKAKIDYETGKIVRADSPDQPLMLGTEVATFDKIVPLVAEFGEYNKGFKAPSQEQIIIPGNGNQEGGETTVTRATNKNLEAMKELEKEA